MNVLLADVGGTHTRCAIFAGDTVQSVKVVHNKDCVSLESILVEYQKLHSFQAETVMLGVAGQVRNNSVKLLNYNWGFSGESICKATGAKQAHLYNDFEALAYALPFLARNEYKQLGGELTTDKTTKAVIGPGTGLGVSGLVWSGTKWIALSGEGGHATLSATTDQEQKLCQYLRKRFNRASIERALSGDGLSNIYHFLTGETLTPKDISELAKKKGAAACETFSIFFNLLGSLAGDLALTLGATGGLYIGGGIMQKNMALFNEAAFRKRFEDKGRYSWYVAKIPVFCINSETPAFAGLRYLATRTAP